MKEEKEKRISKYATKEDLARIETMFNQLLEALPKQVQEKATIDESTAISPIPKDLEAYKKEMGLSISMVSDEVHKDAVDKLGKWKPIIFYENHKGFQKYCIIFTKKHSANDNPFWEQHKNNPWADEHSIVMENGDNTALEWNNRVNLYMQRYSKQ